MTESPFFTYAMVIGELSSVKNESKERAKKS